MNYIVDSDDLTSVANAIRTKGGTSVSLAFPAEFVSAIAAIPSGGGGLVYETGTFTPTTDIVQPTISFSNTHTKCPWLVACVDSDNTYYTSSNTSMCMVYFNSEDWNGSVVYQSTTTLRYGAVTFINRSTNSTGLSGTLTNLTHSSSESDSSSSAYPRFWVSETSFKPRTNSTSYWRNGRHYKWIAIWS